MRVPTFLFLVFVGKGSGTACVLEFPRLGTVIHGVFPTISAATHFVSLVTFMFQEFPLFVTFMFKDFAVFLVFVAVTAPSRTEAT